MGFYRRFSKRHTDDQGAVVILFVVMLFSLLVVTALVVDLGGARATKRETQSNADLAAIAAGFNLSGGGSPGLISDPAAACASALNSLRTNIPDLPAATALTPGCSTFPSSAALCTASTPMATVASGTTAEPYRITIDYPVPASAIARAEFDGTEGLASQPGVGSMDGDQCERMRISVRRQNETVFAGVMGRDGEVINSSATVRATSEGDGLAIPALLLLERTRCGTLQVSGQGGVRVAANTPAFGVIHSDTSSQVPPCTTNNNAGGWAIYGTERPPSTGGGPSIIAEGTATQPGRINVYGLKPGVGGRGGYTYPTGLNVQPTGGKIISRQIVDDRYNDPANPYIKNTHEFGRVITVFGASYTDPVALDNALTNHVTYGGPQMCQARDDQCWAVISGNQCSQQQGSNVVYQGRNLGPLGSIRADNYYVMCDNYTARNVVFRNGIWNDAGIKRTKMTNGSGALRYGRVIFGGKLETAGNPACAQILADDTYYRCADYVAFPNADEIFLRGCVTQCNGGGMFAIKSSGFMAINHGEDLVLGGANVSRPDLMDAGTVPPNWPWLDCTKRRNGPGDGGLYGEWTKLVSMRGPLTVSNGTFSWCQTTYYAGKPTATYSRDTVTSGGNCSAVLPCPTDSGTEALINVNSGSSLPISWQAPNQTDTGPGVTSNFEDLALWTEGGGDAGECTIAGQGALRGGGIFFHPNCRINYGGQTDNDNPLNAQFIGRSLNIAGQGVLKLKPNAKDSIQVRVAGDVILIR